MRRLLALLPLFAALAGSAKADAPAAAAAAATEPPFSYSSCVAPDKEAGQCVRIKNCPFLYDIFNDEKRTPAQSKLLSESQCGLDNTRSGGLLERVLVCCPDSKCQNSTSIGPRSSDSGNVLPNIGVCGTLLANRIIGGTRTALYEFPWMALLQYKKPGNQFGFHCGGALISTRYILTAGHCLSSTKLPKTWLLHSVRLGEWDTSAVPDCVTELNKKRSCAPPHIDVEVERRLLHESYVPASIDQLHDIALLRLKETVVYTDYVKPICLPIADEVRQSSFVGYAMDVAGWGFTEHARPSDIKLKLSVNVWNITRCQAKYRTYQVNLNGDTQTCAGGKENEDTCSGDSGGPLMLSNRVGNQEVLFAAGVTSFGPTPCGLAGWPGIYTRVGAYIDWIQQQLQP